MIHYTEKNHKIGWNAGGIFVHEKDVVGGEEKFYDNETILTMLNQFDSMQSKGLIDIEKLRENPEALAELIEAVIDAKNSKTVAEALLIQSRIKQSISKLK